MSFAPILLSIFSIFFYAGVSKPELKFVTRCFIVAVLGAFVVFFLGFRGETVGTDTERYVNYFSEVSRLSLMDALALGRFEPFFAILVWSFAKLNLTANVFFSFVALLLLYSIYKASLVITNSKVYAVLTLIVFLCWPFYYSLSINVLRQSIAVSFMMLSLVSVLKGNTGKSVIYSVIAMQFHVVGFLYLVFVLINRKALSLVKSFYIWLGLVLVSILDLSKQLVLNIVATQGYSRILEYEGFEKFYKTGFRLDFFLLSCFPIALYFLLRGSERKKNELLMKGYLLLNSTYFFFAFMPFSDRYAINSWMLIPFFVVLLIKQYNYLLFIVMPALAIASFFHIEYLGV